MNKKNSFPSSIASFLAKRAVAQLMSPTLMELFKQYNPKFINGRVVWFKKPNKEKDASKNKI